MQKAFVVTSFLLMATATHAQWLSYRAPGTPTNADGQVNLAAPTPRMPDGKPDLSGIWNNARGNNGNNPGGDNRQRNDLTPAVEPALPGGPNGGGYFTNIFRDMKPENVPERPVAKSLREARMKDGTRPNPTVFCLPMGIPSANFVPEVVKFVQSANEIVIFYEADNSYRQVYLDGRPLPKDMNPSWLGYSTGHWDGDTLVVETEGFNDRTWLDMTGHSHSESLHLTERYHRTDYGHMDIEMTFNDPVMYTKPFTIKFKDQLRPDTDILESYCNENEKDRQHIQGAHEIPAH
jgi:hypothetical protein